MQCNIDRKGRWVRAIGGIVAIVAAAALLVLVPQERAAWIVAAILFLAGAFQFYEAWKGWCAIRAMGIKTPW